MWPRGRDKIGKLQHSAFAVQAGAHSRQSPRLPNDLLDLGRPLAPPQGLASPQPRRAGAPWCPVLSLRVLGEQDDCSMAVDTTPRI